MSPIKLSKIWSCSRPLVGRAGRDADVIQKVQPRDSLHPATLRERVKRQVISATTIHEKDSTTSRLSTPDTLKTTDTDKMAAVKPIVGVCVPPGSTGQRNGSSSRPWREGKADGLTGILIIDASAWPHHRSWYCAR